MPYLKNDLFLKAIWREPVTKTPIWIMRQAGRYLPEYRAARERAGSFLRLCKTPELACEVTLQPIHRFALDAAIIFSDILTIPDAMGLGLHFEEGKGPFFTQPLRNTAQIECISLPDPEKLKYVYESIKLVKHELDGKVPLIGFCGSPWTLSAYMIDGQSTKDTKTPFPLTMKMLKEEPASLHKLLNILADAVCLHLNEQIKAGVQAVMIFDTWGGLLDSRNYQEFSLYYIKQVLSGLLRQYDAMKIPVILFTRQGAPFLEMMADTGCDMVGVDWEISLKEARYRTKDKVALQGNMHPNYLRKSSALIRQEAAQILEAYGPGSGHVFNLGHGITPDIDPEQVAVLIDAVHHLSDTSSKTKR